MQALSVASSVRQIADPVDVKGIAERTRQIYENAASELRDADASMGGEVAFAFDSGEYAALFDEIQDSTYEKIYKRMEGLTGNSAAADIFFWVPDYERHRMVFVMFVASDKHQSEIEPPGYWIDMFEEDEQYTLMPDPQGQYIGYERVDEETGQDVRYVQCTLPLYPDTKDSESGAVFVTVDIEWRDVQVQTLGYLRDFLIAVSILTLILAAVSQLVLRHLMVNPLKKVIVEQERIAKDLALGADIQQSVLPETVTRHFGPGDRVTVFGSMKPALETGGDFFDYYLIDDDHLVLLIADVSEKGIPAALFMMMSKILIDSFASQGLEPGKALERANDAIHAKNKEDMFVTVWLGVLELSTGILRAANAGHEKPVIRRAGGDFEIYADIHGVVAGRLENMEYETYEQILNAGDTLFLFTDGLTEAMDADHRMLGAKGMLSALNVLSDDASPEDVCRHIYETVEQFAKGVPQSDDLTLLCVKIEK